MKQFSFFFLVFSSIHLFSQELDFKSLPMKELPSTEVYQVLQDKEGIIWIATDAGICRYDGTSMKTYTVTDGITENVVVSIYEDYKRRIWFNTLSTYFFYYENGHFVKPNANKKLRELFAPFPLSSFLVGENDTLFMNNRGNYGIVKVPPENNYGNVIQENNTSPATRYAKQSKSNPFELLAGYGAGRYTKDSAYTFELFDTIITLSLKGIIGNIANGLNGRVKRGHDGTVYIPSRNLLTVVKEKGKKISYYRFPDDIQWMLEDKDNDLWIGLHKYGGRLYKQGNLNSKPIHFLNDLSVSSIFIDREGIIWATTLEKGIFQCMNKHVLQMPGKIMDFYQKDDYLRAIFFYNKEISFYRSDSVFYRSSQPAFYQNTSLLTVFENTETAYYSTKEGIYCRSIQHPEAKAERISTVVIQQFIALEKDTLLAVSNSSISHIYKKRLMPVIVPFAANSALKLRDGRVLIGGRGTEGLFEYRNKKLIRYLPEFPVLKTRINWLTEDRNGNIWIATNEQGIFCYKKNGDLYLLQQKHGLPSNKINTCLEDENGSIWCGTFKGLSKIIPLSASARVRIENFDINHGVADMEISKMHWFNHKIWCAGKSNFFFFDPHSMKKNTHPPGLYIKSLLINNKSSSQKDSIVLNHDQNNFRVQYGLISHKKTGAKTFLYRLVGYDTDWKISATGDIQYTNIGHGHYTLIAYALNNDGVKNEQPLRLCLWIKKPIWYSWWFIALEIIALIAFVGVIAAFWKRRIEKKERDKASINQKMAEFKMTALRAQMNPHFIYNAIGSIQHYILKNEIEQSFNYLSKFSSLIRKILNSSRNEYISLSQEISTLQLYMELEQIRFKYPFKFIVTVDDELDTEMDIPTMLIQPYVENSIWHGLMPKDAEGLLELIFRKSGNILLVVIRDNGVGRERGDLAKKYHISKGMSLTQQRIQTLESISTKKFDTKIIDLKNENGEPAGTEVNLMIPFDE